MTRTRRRTLTFKQPFTLKGIERQLPAGEYELVDHGSRGRLHHGDRNDLNRSRSLGPGVQNNSLEQF
jgi:hypothetical protein